MRFVCSLAIVLFVCNFLALSQEKPPLISPDISQLQANAEAGDLKAQVALARAYLDGNGVAANDTLALKWLRRAADENYSDAENELGILYSSGRAVEKNKEEAFKWYKKAAKHGSASGMFNLGACYYNGDGVNIDDAMAYGWFTLASQAGSRGGADAVARSNTEYSPRIIQEGIRNIGDFYASGKDLPRDVTQAIKWYTKTAEHGDTEAQVKLAILYAIGEGFSPDYNLARRWCEEAAKKRDGRGAFCLGALYQRGLGVQQDSRMAAKWYEKSDTPPAMKSLAKIYQTGEAGKIDQYRAFILYARAASYGDKPSLAEAAKLRRQLDVKQWKKASKELSALRIDPTKLDALLQQPIAQ